MPIDWEKEASAPPKQSPKAGIDWEAAASPKAPPRHPWRDRLGAAGSNLAQDFTPSDENVQRMIGPGGVGAQVAKIAGDALQIPMAAYGGAAEHAQRTMEGKGGVVPAQIHPPPGVSNVLAQVLLPGTTQGTGQFLQNAWNAFAAQPGAQRAKMVGDVAEVTGVPGLGEGFAALSDAAKVARLASATGKTQTEIRAMIKAGTPIEQIVKEPGVLERLKGGVKTAVKAARGNRDTDRVLTDAEKAEEAKRGQATVQRIVNRLDPTGKKLSENPVEAAGKPITAGEALGVKGRSHQRLSATRGAEGGDILQEQLKARTAGAPHRVTQDFADATGLLPEEVEGNFDAAIEKRRLELDPKYKEAHAEDVIESEKMRQLYTRPPMQDALKEAYEMMETRGLKPEELGLQMKTTQVERGTKGLQRVEGPKYVEIKTPNAQTLDYVKRALQDMVKANMKDGRLTSKGQGINELLKEFREEIYEANPKLKAAAADAGDVLKQEEAFDNTGKLFGPQTTDTEFKKVVGKMTLAEKRATLAGMLRDVRQEAGKTRFSTAKFLGPDYKNRVEFLLNALNPEEGAAKAKTLFERIDMEAQLQRNAGRIAPETGSVTSQAMLTASEQDQMTELLLKHGPKLLSGKRGVIDTALEATGGFLKGAYEGYKVPAEEAAHDEITRLLRMSPSELHSYLLERKMNPPTIAKVERLFNRARARKWGMVRSGAVAGSMAQEQGQGQPGP